MRAIVFAAVFLFSLMSPTHQPASEARPNIASYSIAASLDPETRLLTGSETIVFTNTVVRPIPDLVFHLYLNAFKSPDTFFMREWGASGFKEQDNGWIEVTGLRLKDGPELPLELLEDGTLAWAVLPSAISRGGKISIQVEFRARLPHVISRTGWAFDQQGDPFFMVGQWFPKLGVWQEEGWNAYPFHANSEFFADFGNYDVAITLPEAYNTAATGELVSNVLDGAGVRTVRYSAQSVIDFAWAASPNLRVQSRQAAGVHLIYAYLPEHEWSVQTALDAAELAMKSYGQWYGAYPYSSLTVLDVPEEGRAMGGMEYPMLVAAGAGPNADSGGFFGGGEPGLVMLIAHEVGHQWWQAVVATNEAEEPWLDEGFTDYSTARLVLKKYGIHPGEYAKGRYGNAYLDFRRSRFLSNPRVPMAGRAWDFREDAYVPAVYAKPTLSLLTLGSIIGDSELEGILRIYYQRYRFDHPTSEDFRRILESFEGAPMGWFFDGLVYGREPLNYAVKSITNDSVTLVRTGPPIAAPVIISFKDNTAQEIFWGDRSADETLYYPDKPGIERVEIDPKHTRYLELDWKDNEAYNQPPPQTMFRLPPRPKPQAQQVASYTIDVRLDDASRSLNGRETITYLNTTSRSIPDLVFHLYLNAFKNADTFFLKESSDNHRGFAWDSQHPGSITVRHIRIAGGPELDLRLLEDGTMARAVLPRPVDPGKTVEIEVEFTAQLPKVFARTGWALDQKGDPFFMVGQWFPKLGVWQETGWNAYPFHANSEFFADFGRYDVRITLPGRYRSGATGVEVGDTTNGDGTHTVAYQAQDVIDFAWVASPNIQTAVGQANGVQILYLYLPEHAWSVSRELDAAQRSIQRYSEWFGPYPYPRLTLVDPPDDGQGAGGMEYPSLVTLGTLDVTGLGGWISQTGRERSLEVVATHEIAHQWWQSVVATNEAEEPWLDEGMADYSAARLMQVEYGAGSVVDLGALRVGYPDMRRSEYVTMPDVPMAGKAWDFNALQYGIAAYSKPAMALLTLQGVLGEQQMNMLMHDYYARWRFGHPTARDFQDSAEESTGMSLDWFFGSPADHSGLVYGSGTVNYSAAAISEKSFTVIRQGDLEVPVQIRVNFSDGVARIIQWDGRETQRTFTFDRSLDSFVIDPQHALAVELSWADNSLSRRPDWQSWLAVVASLVYHLQDLLLAMGGI